ncbi:autotransporter outer membrane beta-barrel domain-containing protein [Xanthobacter dioxanivorans]|uniref:Autotransporter outer membrane beta-barrel domain-containing protein n=1 Tax=Xanthobacter dioxanivorans TaxID=2528964 RepID=A0A974SJC2_9HYPH|nr:autotransporter outer membrane beta-barrel domain-containing protein [Xanthobacter dioxanivorans]QRG07357.1 autotransporter outer membrane beta-barrel domain-containing protein [Xanthobacter dioxanivorans]
MAKGMGRQAWARSLAERRLELCASASVLAFAVATSPTLAQTYGGTRNSLFVNPSPIHGQDAYSTGWIFKDYYQATQGADGKELNVVTNGTIRAVDPTQIIWMQSIAPALVVGSEGGHGGAGLKRDYQAFGGGAGGKVTVENNAKIGLSNKQGDKANPTALVSIYSKGGKGGNGNLYVGSPNNELYASAGRGGDGGAVTFSTSTGFVTEGNYIAGLSVSSRGGAGGDYGLLDDDALESMGYGHGGATGLVTVTIKRGADIETWGWHAPGIVVESVGGDGSSSGNGYDTRGASAGHAYANNEDRRSIIYNGGGKVTTRADDAPAILLQSIGGAGGTGGQAAVSGRGTRAGDGGNGGQIEAVQSGAVKTSGANSYGIVAQSVGGAGGKGGNGIASGGNGGNGGNGGKVGVEIRSEVSTSGANANGVVAQSIGGGRALQAFQPGDGTIVIGGGDGGESFAMWLGTGGNGGTGGTGGDVTVTNEGTVRTGGKEATGVLAQSIGGGGGGGGSALVLGAAFSVSRGGASGGGGDGGTVEVINNLGYQGVAGGVFTTGDNAAGILAQSVGGGGGSGGAAVAATASAVVSSATALGGTGGGGGNGGTVKVSGNAAVSTAGERSHGIEAMSIGGGGGDGGASYALAYSQAVHKSVPNIAVGVALGGSGGKGGNGGTVTVNTSGTVTTTGADAFGILGLSVGGGGGDGGISDARTKASGSALVDISTTVSLGGTGGDGGKGGEVKIDSSGDVSTKGDQAIGIAAYSIGGGGGAGGSAYAAGAVSGATGNVGVNVAVGGKGGGGNTGGTAKVKNAGTIETEGYGAHGIHALSVGGGGGNGGAGTVAASSSGIGIGKDKPKDGNPGGNKVQIKAVVDVGVGGAGGGGSNGGLVEVVNTATVTTRGVEARGILAQSIGGGGGVGGAGTTQGANTVQVNVSVGAKGGGASDGGDVTVKNLSSTAAITTYGDGAHGIQAQSIGGGGGSGGSGAAGAGETTITKLGASLAKNGLKALAMKVLPKFSAKYGIKADIPIKVTGNVTIGGSGGSGGNGKAVTVQNEGGIDTYGQVAAAIYAQSIGGGGGDGGAASMSGASVANSIKMANGASGGAAGNGGTVTVTNTATGRIQTAGDSSFGILAQSVGGGGGKSTLGMDYSSALLSTPSLISGGSAGARGTGGEVTVTNAGAIITGGAEAHGVIAQSIGGGGGVLVLDIADPYTVLELKSLTASEKATLRQYGVDVDALIKEAEAAKKAETATVQKLSLQLGATGGAFGDAGTVTVKQSNTISTTGNGAFGIIAQSIGGGGGLISDGGGSSIGTMAVTGRLGGSANSSGNGGLVAIELGTGSITTTGKGAVGIFAQSIGGGGGYTGALDTTAATYDKLLAQKDPSTGVSGGVLIKMADPSSSVTISTTGKNAHGVFAQAIGGGGGAIATEEGIVLPSAIGTTDGRTPDRQGGGLIEIALKGSVTATGDGAMGIYAQSGAQGGSGRVVLGTGKSIRVLMDGTLTGGSGTGAALFIDGGDGNHIEFRPGSTVSALSGIAVESTWGRDTLRNFGTLIGDVDLALGGTGEVNSFINELGGTYVSSTRGIVSAGLAGTIQNDGAFNIGGTNSFATATVTGGYVQSATGSLMVDVESSASGQQSDLLKLTGSATVEGSIDVHVVNALKPGRFGVIELGKGGSVTAVAQSGTYSPISWSVVRDADMVYVSPNADFSAPGGVDMTQSEDRTTAALQGRWNSGSVDMSDAKLFGQLANASSVQDYTRSIDSITPEESASVASAQTLGAMTSMKMAMSCPIFAGSGTLMEETSCAWARITGSWVHQTSSADAGGYSLNGVTYRLGAQKEISDDWFLGVTAGLTQSWLSDVSGLSDTSGVAGDIAVSLKHQVGPWLFAASGHFGYGSFDTDRLLDVGPALWRTQGTSDVLTAAARLRASYEFVNAGWYLKPFADVDFLYTGMPGYTEQGAGGMSLHFFSADQWNVAISPQLEIGGRIDLTPEFWLRPYASAGASFFANDGMDIGVSLGATPGLVPDFFTRTTIPSVLGNVTAGLQLFSTTGYELRTEYKADFGNNYLAQEASVRFAVTF